MMRQIAEQMRTQRETGHQLGGEKIILATDYCSPPPANALSKTEECNLSGFSLSPLPWQLLNLRLVLIQINLTMHTWLPCESSQTAQECAGSNPPLTSKAKFIQDSKLLSSFMKANGARGNSISHLQIKN